MNVRMRCGGSPSFEVVSRFIRSYEATKLRQLKIMFFGRKLARANSWNAAAADVKRVSARARYLPYLGRYA